jgi:hypothetical protein
MCTSPILLKKSENEKRELEEMDTKNNIFLYKKK